MGLLLILIYLIFPQRSFAGDPCGDFYKFACAHRDQNKDDGTGSAKSLSVLKTTLTDFEKMERNKFNSDFDELLRTNVDLQKRVTDESGCASSLEYQNCLIKNREEIKINLFNRYVAISQEPVVERPVTLMGTLMVPVSIYEAYWSLDNESAIKDLITKSQSRLDTALVPIVTQNRLQKEILKTSKESIKAVFARLPESSEKQKLIKTIDSVKIKVKPCGGREEILKPNAYYNALTNTVIFCASMLFRSDSLFSIMVILTHEITHSINPENHENLLKPLIGCLRRPGSVGAMAGWRFSPREQIREVFCDWMATEVLANLASQNEGYFANLKSEQFTNGIANALPFCEFSKPMDTRSQNHHSHPLLQDRINLIANHPTIRTRMGCANHGQQVRCDFTGARQDSTTEMTEQSGIVR